MASSSTQEKGYAIEKAAADLLAKAGLTLVQKNYRCKLGEIDLVMRDHNQLVFVEVRFRKSARHGSALESVTASKQRKLLRAAQFYLQTTRNMDNPCRFDIVAVMPKPHNPERLHFEWIQNAIESVS